MKTESCEPPVDIDWEEASILEVVLSAQEGVPAAKAELARREKQIDELSKNANIEKANPNHDSHGRFTFGSGKPQAGGDNNGPDNAGEAGAGGENGNDGVGSGKDIASSELARDYGQVTESKLAKELRLKDTDPSHRGDPVLKDIAHRQGFDGEADLVDEETFNKVVANGGTVTYRGITDYHDGPGPDAKYIQGDAEITQQFAKGSYHAGGGVYGSGTYTSTEIEVANHYAFEDGSSGAVVKMAIKPNARIATPLQWHEARQTVKNGKGGFIGADNEGRLLAAKGFDGYRILSPNVDNPSSNFIVMLNRKALVVLKK